jgi:hypothetical protein
MKAKIKKPINFSIRSSSIDFGISLLGELSYDSQAISICNTSQKQTRQFELYVNSDELKYKFCEVFILFEILDDSDIDKTEVVYMNGNPIEKKKKKFQPSLLLSDEIEEQIEQAQQKLKIAERKGKPEKVKKIKDKLEKLKSGVVAEDYADTGALEGGSSVLGDDVIMSPSHDGPISSLDHDASQEDGERFIRKLNRILVSVEPREIKAVKVYIFARPIGSVDVSKSVSVEQRITEPEICAGLINIHEFKNTDTIKKV